MPAWLVPPALQDIVMNCTCVIHHWLVNKQKLCEQHELQLTNALIVIALAIIHT